MTRKQIVEAIMNDMYKNASTTSKQELDRRYKGYLNSLKKAELETIYSNRFKKQH